MERKMKKWMVAAIILIACLVTFFAVMGAFNWDFSILSTTQFETNAYELDADFGSITIETDTADILFAVSDNGQSKVVCFEAENAKHSVTVEDGTLHINVVDERKWYEFIGITVYTPKITVYLPKSQYAALSIRESTGDVKIPDTFQFTNMDICTSTGDVKNYASVSDVMKIKTTTGNIHIESVTAGAMDLSVSTGKVNLREVTCKNLVSTGDTGDLLLEKVIAQEKFDIERDTGDVRFVDCDAAEIFVETDTGNVTGSLLTEKVFIARTDTGRVDVPKTVTGGRCEITTDTGNIKITIS